MLTLAEVREVLADVKLDSTSGESGFANGMSDALRAFRDRIALGAGFTPEELARARSDGEKNAQFIIESRRKPE